MAALLGRLLPGAAGLRHYHLRWQGMVDMDVSGAETLAALLDDLDARGTRLVLARVRSSLRTTLRRLGVEQRLGTANIHLSVRRTDRVVRDRLRDRGTPAVAP